MGTLRTTDIKHLNAANTNISFDANGRVGIMTANPMVGLDLSGMTDGLRLPVGTTALRPTGNTGMLRFNSTTGRIEHYFNSAWADNINKVGDFAWKEGPSSFNAAWKFNWAKSGSKGTSLDAATYGYGILVNEAGWYNVDTWWRGNQGNYMGIGINGDRGSLEGADSYGLWGHDHTYGNGAWTHSRYIGYLEAGWIISSGSPSSGGGNYDSEGYSGGLVMMRFI